MTSHKPKFAPTALLAATTLVVAACGGGSRDDTPPPAAANYPPTATAIADRTSDQDTVVGPIAFDVADAESDPARLVVTAMTDGNAVIPADGVTLGGTGGSRTITLTPLESATGTVNITLTVTDPDGAIGRRAFVLTVNPHPASVRDVTLATFAKSESDDVTPINGFTFTQDADDSASFEPQVGGEQ
jgi:hypothetical protein